MTTSKDQTVIDVRQGMEKLREKVWSEELGCHTAMKFQISNCPDIRVNVVYTMVLALGFFLTIAQLLPFGGFDTSFWCPETATMNKVDTKPYYPLSESLLHEKINTSSINVSHGELRVFKPHGMGTHLYIEMGAYRGGPRVFSIVGLTSKPIETHHQPPYACEWVSGSSGQVVKGRTHKVLPDWDYGKLYTVGVVTCKFNEDVGVDRQGGELILYASYGDQFRKPERIIVLTESIGEYNESIFNPPYPYDYVYCGSSVYGDISPQRMREWLAYHAKFLGERSHFILHDSGGFHEDVRKVLEPWIKQGRVTLQNIRQQEIYDGYYHNQFLVVNDCLFRSRFMANWTFFFDIDEYMYVEPTTTLSNVLNENPNITQITIEQVSMAGDICVADNNTQDEHARRWGFEKLVYRKVLKRGIRYDRKYVVQGRHAEAAGIHMSMNMLKGKNLYPKGDRIRYYHYHGTINKRGRFYDTAGDAELGIIQLLKPEMKSFNAAVHCTFSDK